ncbi:MAG: hypothetical protein AAB675_02350 [Patescibacteria group bacterium]
MIKSIDRKKIVECVRKEVKKANKEIIVTMLLSEEIENPLPRSYHTLLQKKVQQGILVKRLGFGTKEEYNQINFMYKFNSKNYIFRYEADINYYQRLIIIDGKLLFFGVDDMFFQSSYKQLIEAFLSYFSSVSKKGRKK